MEPVVVSPSPATVERVSPEELAALCERVDELERLTRSVAALVGALGGSFHPERPDDDPVASPFLSRLRWRGRVYVVPVAHRPAVTGLLVAVAAGWTNQWFLDLVLPPLLAAEETHGTECAETKGESDES